MKNPLALAGAITPLAYCGRAAAQYGQMVDNGTGGAPWVGGLGGLWTLILLVLAVLGGVLWVILRNRK